MQGVRSFAWNHPVGPGEETERGNSAQKRERPCATKHRASSDLCYLSALSADLLPQSWLLCGELALLGFALCFRALTFPNRYPTFFRRFRFGFPSVRSFRLVSERPPLLAHYPVNDCNLVCSSRSRPTGVPSPRSHLPLALQAFTPDSSSGSRSLTHGPFFRLVVPELSPVPHLRPSLSGCCERVHQSLETL